MRGTGEQAGSPLGAVLAGGRGSRLGGAKAAVELAGRALIEYPLAAVEAAGLEPVVVAKPGSELPPLEVAVVREPEHPHHPLRGIVAALGHAAGRAVVAVGCDMPFITPALLAALASAPQPLVVPAVAGSVHPLPGRYGPELLPDLEAALAAEASLRGTIASLHPRLLGDGELTAFGDPQRLCFNVNTPADLELAAGVMSPAEH